MQINTAKLKAFIADYKDLIQTPQYEELYKWEAVKNFTENWQENPSDVVGMLDRCLTASFNNLWVGTHFYLKRMLLEMAQQDGHRVLEMLKELFDESVALEERIVKFYQEAEEIRQEVFPEKSSYHDSRAAMLYLGLKYPDKHPLYKYNMARDFAILVESSEPISKAQNADPFKPVHKYLEICNLVRKELEQDQELIQIHRALLDPVKHYIGNYGALLTQDFIYCTTAYLSLLETAIEDEEDEEDEDLTDPTIWLLAPGEGAKFWDVFFEKGIMGIGWNELGDLRQYASKIEIAQKMRELYQTTSSKKK